MYPKRWKIVAFQVRNLLKSEFVNANLVILIRIEGNHQVFRSNYVFENIVIKDFSEKHIELRLRYPCPCTRVGVLGNFLDLKSYESLLNLC